MLIYDFVSITPLRKREGSIVVNMTSESQKTCLNVIAEGSMVKGFGKKCEELSHKVCIICNDYADVYGCLSFFSETFFI